MAGLRGTYDASMVSVLVNGVPVAGSGESDIVAIEYDEQEWNKVYGARGEAARSKQNSPGGTITLTVMQTDRAAIEYLESLIRIDSATGAGVVSIMVKDLRSGEGVTAPQAWIQTRAAITFGRDLNEREYVFDCAELIRI